MKEDEIVREIIDNFGLTLKQHNSDEDNFFSLLSSKGFTSLSNIKQIQTDIVEVENSEALQKDLLSLVALMRCQIDALSGLMKLQLSWANNVENDPASHNELEHYK